MRTEGETPAGLLATSQGEDIIDATPTKRFFIDMLIRDIELLRAIADLVDNAVDGARRMRGSDEGVDFSGLRVDVTFDQDHFVIEDNCGGIPITVARNYAFRFGRAEGAPETPHSVGQFGVGMKRAIFKLGRRFRVESRTNGTWFVVDEDVEEWNRRPEWSFRFERLSTGDPPLAEPGTRVAVRALHESVATTLGLPMFERSLQHELAAAHLMSMAQGLAIVVNGSRLEARFNELLASDDIRPAHKTMIADPDPARHPVIVKIYVGLIESAPKRAGWDVFCNGRLVLEADQTETTGWGTGPRTAHIPEYHNQYARFKGYVFFDCSDAGLLPWNTTKTGVDTDSPIYQAVRQQMVVMMRPVIDFLNKVDRENDVDVTETPLTSAVEAAKPVRLSEFRDAELPAAFVAPRPPASPSAIKLSRIAYSRPVEAVAGAKAALGVSTLKEVGERTFDYYYDLEVEG